MYHPDKNHFLERARKGNLVPVWREIILDQDTPVSAYERLRKALRRIHHNPRTFLLESVEGGEHIGRYSFIGGVPRAVFKSFGRHVEIENDHGAVEMLDDVEPLSVLKSYMERFKPVPDPALPRFFGGAVGYIGYDAVAQFEKVPLSQNADMDWPDMMFGITDTILIFDRVLHTVKIVANALIEGAPDRAYQQAIDRIDAICARLTTPVPRYVIDADADYDEMPFEPNMTPEAYRRSVERAKEYIRAGDIIQVVLSQRFKASAVGDPLDIYRALRTINPSPYMFCLEFGEHNIVGSSPEIHVRCEEGRTELRPIAGTRPRSKEPHEDARLAEELLQDPKERAEHIMLVDLARNDLGRVCDIGSVSVPELIAIERYSHVMHIVSDVTGKLSSQHDIYDVMRATFPAGTVSGAPKIRAMEIIGELEQTRRGPYAGAVSYFSFTGNLDSAITIRTVLLDDQHAYIQAGAGIVADSDPQKEYDETRNKARGMLKALSLARRYAAVREGV